MREAGTTLFKQAYKEFKENGLLPEDKPEKSKSIKPDEEPTAGEIDKELETVKTKVKDGEKLDKLEELLEKCQNMKNGMPKTKRIRIIRLEITKAKRTSTISAHSKDDTENESIKSETPKSKSSKDVKNATSTPVAGNNSISSNGSPTVGVNRRTAVLFTRKAQAALKKPNSPVKVETSGVKQYVFFYNFRL